MLRRTRLVLPVCRAPVNTTTGRCAALPLRRPSIRRGIHILQILRFNRRNLQDVRDTQGVSRAHRSAKERLCNHRRECQTPERGVWAAFL